MIWALMSCQQARHRIKSRPMSFHHHSPYPETLVSQRINSDRPCQQGEVNETRKQVPTIQDVLFLFLVPPPYERVCYGRTNYRSISLHQSLCPENLGCQKWIESLNGVLFLISSALSYEPTVVLNIQALLVGVEGTDHISLARPGLQGSTCYY
jgi:hypothetical protein